MYIYIYSYMHMFIYMNMCVCVYTYTYIYNIPAPLSLQRELADASPSEREPFWRELFTACGYGGAGLAAQASESLIIYPSLRCQYDICTRFIDDQFSII